MLISRVIPVYRQFVRDRETADLFHSFAACGDEVVCAIRRHGIRDVYNAATPPPYESRIFLQQFDLPSGKFVADPSNGQVIAPMEIMPVGEDPRCIGVGGRPFVLTANSPGQNLNYVLFDVNAQKRINIEFRSGTSSHVRYGKNWQPFVFDDELYAVHGFSPFRILKIDAATGACDVVFEKEIGFDLAAPHDKFTHFRGGSSALVLDGEIVGFAHFTLDSGRHMLFRWTFSPANGTVSLQCDVDTRFLTAEGFHIIDPTSFFAFRGQLYLGLSCSNRDWFYGQTYASFLLELQNDPKTGGGRSLREALAQPAEAHDNSLAPAPPRVYFYRADEMYIANGAIGRNHEVLAKPGRDQPGFVIHGPYIDLCAARYRARVQYASPGSLSKEIGYVDVCSNQQGNQTILAKKQFPGTNGNLAFVEIEFDIRPAGQGRAVETRVVSTGLADLRITDVTIERL
jgi:hypothetical protein